MGKYISFSILNDYGRNKKDCVHSVYPKDKYQIVNKSKYKKYTTYYLKLKTKWKI